MKSKDKMTIKDVARHAGVGLGTVSRAINGATEISPETRQKVLDSIRELGYVPNRDAHSMRSQKYRHIAHFVSNIANSAFAQIAKGIQEMLESKGYMLSLYNTGDINVAEQVREFLGQRQVDGIILSIPREDEEELHAFLVGIKVPIVTLDREIPGIPAGIVTDYPSAVRQATEYLLSLGHRGIKLVTGTVHILPTRVSIEAYRRAYQIWNVEFQEDSILSGSFSEAFGRKVIHQCIPQIVSGKTTSIIYLNNKILQGMLQVMRERGLEYPCDLSMITVEDSELTQLLLPPVTVIHRPLVKTGRQLARYLLDYINSRKWDVPKPVSIDTELIIRQSCRRIL